MDPLSWLQVLLASRRAAQVLREEKWVQITLIETVEPQAEWHQINVDQSCVCLRVCAMQSLHQAAAIMHLSCSV